MSILPERLGGTGQEGYVDGELLIGDSTTSGLRKSTLTAGSGVTITNAHGNITIANSTLGTVTSISAGAGITLTPNPITTGGSVAVTAGQIPGTTTNDNASAGNVGEYTSTIVLFANEVAISNTTANVGNLPLPSGGDWDVWGEIWFDTLTGAATVSGQMVGGLTTTSVTLPTVPADNSARTSIDATVLSSANKIPQALGPIRISATAATTVFLVGSATSSAGTVFAYCKIAARRVR